MKWDRKPPACAETECASCEEGRCNALAVNDFWPRKCPFFKTREQVAKEKEYCEKRLADIRKENEEDYLC